jgi:hypothetical protein
VVLLEERERIFPWLASAGAAFLVALPWILVEITGHMEWSGVVGGEPLGEAIRGGVTLVPSALPYTVAVFLGGFGVAPSLRDLHGGVSREVWMEVLPFLVLLATGLIWALGAALGDKENRPQIRSLILLILVPVAAAALVAGLGLKAFSPRYVATVQPILILLVAQGWTRVVSGHRLWALVLAGLLLVPALAGGWRQATHVEYARADYREVARFLAREATGEDLILQQGVSGVFEYYYRGAATVDTYYPVYRREADQGFARLDSLVAGHPRVFWVGSRLWYDDPEGWLPRALANRSSRVREHPGVPGIEVREYHLAGSP